MLGISNLHMDIDECEVLYGVNPKVNEGEIHAFLGLNDSKKLLMRILSLNSLIIGLSAAN
jgi:Fe-S cluster assembly ATPase SufC